MKKMSKKIISLLLAAMIVFGSVAVGVAEIDFAEIFTTKAEAATEYTQGYYTYTVTDGEATITAVAYSISGDVVVPSTLGGFPVTSIGDYAFYMHFDITSIEIPYGVTSIGDYACYWTGIKSIEIPASVTSIGVYAFDCDLGYTVDPLNTAYSSDENGVLFNKNKTELIRYPNRKPIYEYEIPASVTSIGIGAFDSCYYIENIDVPAGLTYIGDSAFSGCSLTSIDIPAGVSSIGNRAFNGCYLKCITVDSANTAYSSDECGVLFNKDKTELIQYPRKNARTTYEIPASVTSINDYAFSYCDSCTSVTFGENCKLTSINDYAFCYCTSLTSIMIPDSVTSIDNSAFSNCTSLTSITIPNSVTGIGGSAFTGCKSLTSITFGENSQLIKINFRAFENCTSLTSITIPDSVTSIGDGAFCNCTSLTSIEIPNSVTSIGNGAFCNCTSLTSIEIPNSVTSIGGSVFAGCKSLTSITIPDGVTIIGSSAFSDCDGLTSVAFGENSQLTSINSGAFENCTSLTSIEIPDSVTVIGDSAFTGCKSLTSITIPDGVTRIGSSAFSDCDGLTSVAFGENSQLTSISDYAFCNCSSLTNIEIPDSVTGIGGSAFAGCKSLTSIEIPNSVTGIGGYAFTGCKSLTSITFGENSQLTSIGLLAFDRCTSLTNITIPDSVTSIRDGAFENCTSLTSITIPASVTDIGQLVFGYCSSLTSVTIAENSQLNIGYLAFHDCTSLEYVHIPTTVTSIGHRMLSETTAYICSTTEDCYAKTYADDNDIEFKLCTGHDDTDTVRISDCEVGDIIEFGWYPQTEVTDEELIAALNTEAEDSEWISYRYYSGTGLWLNGLMSQKDYMRYCDVVYGSDKYRGVVFDTYRPDTTGHETDTKGIYSSQDDNGYYIGTIYWFKYEPIEWRVIDPDTGMVISETILDAQAYNNYVFCRDGALYDDMSIFWGNSSKTYHANNYAKSSMREWLNDDFYNMAFSIEQQNIIETTELENLNCVSKNTSETTYDKIYLPSLNEWENKIYTINPDIAGGQPGSDYAKCQGLTKHYDDVNFRWRLRTAGKTTYSTCVAYTEQSVAVSSGILSSFSASGIRPALNLNPESEIIQTDPVKNTVKKVEIVTLPTITEYYVGDTLDTNGLTIKVTYYDDSSKIFTSGFTCSPTYLSKSGTQTITVSYGGKTCTFDVNVKPNDLVKIEVKTNPTKTEYFVGETLNTTGLVLLATYNNGTTRDITSDYTCTPTKLDTAGEQTIKVSYYGKTCEFKVTVKPVELVKIEVAEEPTKTTYYVGETLDTTGLLLTLYYSDGSTSGATSGYTCTPTKLNTVGTQVITVEYGGFTDTFDVEVIEKPEETTVPTTTRPGTTDPTDPEDPTDPWEPSTTDPDDGNGGSGSGGNGGSGSGGDGEGGGTGEPTTVPSTTKPNGGGNGGSGDDGNGGNGGNGGDGDGTGSEEPNPDGTYDVYFIVDGEIYAHYMLLPGNPVPVPAVNPVIDGLIFLGWTPAIALTMPEHDLTYYASFHGHSYTYTVTDEPDCENHGSAIYTCSCGKSYTVTVPALGHAWGAWTVVVEATATSNGLEKRICSRCGKEEYRDISAPEANFYVLDIEDQEYTGYPLYPAVKVYSLDGERLDECYGDSPDENGYTVDYVNNTDAGVATVTVTGIGEYYGVIKKTFNIVRKDISDLDHAEIPDITDNGGESTPDPVITDNGRVLEKDKDYVLEYENNGGAGQARIIVTGIGNYKGTLIIVFNIVVNNTSFSIPVIGSQVYTGGEICPEFNLFDNGTVLKEGVHYTVEYADNINVGYGRIIITGIGNYSGTIIIIFRIVSIEITKATVPTLPDAESSADYTPDFESNPIIFNGEELEEGVDYRVVVRRNITAGYYEIIIIGIGNFTGTITIYVNIIGTDISKSFTVGRISDVMYEGRPVTPEVSVYSGGIMLERNVDYIVEYRNNNAVGTATVIIRGIGAYRGTITKTFLIYADNSYSIRISTSTYELKYEQSVRLSAEVTPESNRNFRVVWSSSDPSIAKVDENGKVTSCGEGNVTISATLYDEDGRVVTDPYGMEITDRISIKCTMTIWQKIIRFFRNLFSIFSFNAVLADAFKVR